MSSVDILKSVQIKYANHDVFFEKIEFIWASSDFEDVKKCIEIKENKAIISKLHIKALHEDS